MSVQFVVDREGHKTGVFMSLDEYESILNMLEEIADIRDFDERISSNDWLTLEEVEERLRVHD